MVSVVLGVVIIVGIGLMAGGLPAASQVDTDGGGMPLQDGEGQNVTQGEVGNGTIQNISDVSQGTSGMKLSRCVEPLNSTPGTLLVALGFFAVVGLIYYRFSFSAALLGGWTILPPILLVYFLLTNCGGSAETASGGGLPNVPGGGMALDVSLDVPPWALLGVVGLVFVLAIGLMYRSLEEEDVVTTEEEIEEEPELDEFAQAAGRAAERIEEHGVDVDNAVYEAWVEMTELLEVDNPDVYAPGEFAATAIDLGMGESDVMELTELFNEVRYGDRDASPREDRALSILRTIEAEYATDDAQSSDDAADDVQSSDDATNDVQSSDDATDDGGTDAE